MVRVNDLIASVSGKAALGINLGTKDGEIGALGLGLTFLDLYPFFHVHCLSGIYHDPLKGTSGVIRFGRSGSTKQLQKSVDGGLTFANFFQERTNTLQTAYEKDNDVLITSSPGAVRILGNTRKLYFDSYSIVAPINLSGAIPVNTNNPGDLLMLNHSITSGTPINITEQTEAILKARSLGIGTIMLNTGSGIVNVSVGSGYAHFRGGTASNIDTASNSGTVVVTSISDFSDLNNFHGNIGQIGPFVAPKSLLIWSPGLYECSYHVSFDKNAGNDLHLIKCQMFRNTHEPLLHSTSYCLAATTAAGEGSCHATFLLEAKAGDYLNLQCGYDGSVTASNTSVIMEDQAYIFIRKIGSRRHESAILYI